jgi:hypothetical protein
MLPMLRSSPVVQRMHIARLMLQIGVCGLYYGGRYAQNWRTYFANRN